MRQEQTKSVFAALVGRPNVGKSSLLNRLVGEKVAIVTAKPQTTRTRITGILTRGAVQYVFLDTPGIHRPRTRLGERMKKTAEDCVAEVRDYLHGRDVGGRVVIDDATSAAIDAYYEQYGAAE